MDWASLFFHSEKQGYFNMNLNQIKLQMTQAQYYETISDALYGEGVKEAGVIIHEYTHWVQSVGTPYGFYLLLVHHYERELIGQMEELIASRLYEEDHIKISPPFTKYIEDAIFSNIRDEKLRGMFVSWRELYFLIESVDARRDVYYDKLDAHKDLLSVYPECGDIEDVENYHFLPCLYAKVDRFLDRKLSEQIGRHASSEEIGRDKLYSKKNLRAAMATGFNGLSLMITHQSLWESYATVVEFADNPEKFAFPLQSFTKTGQKKFDEYYDPLRYLELYLPSVNYDKSLFLKTCIILFDIVFSPPILPQCVLLREDGISWFDFDIISRFYAVAEAAKYIGPMSAYSSMGEYECAICNVLHWHTPDDVYIQLYRCWHSLDVIPEAKIFQYFLLMRVAGEFLPLNRIRFLGEVYLGNVSPCVLRLKDKVIMNTRFSYDLSLEARSKVLMMDLYLGSEELFPEPLEEKHIYLQYALMQELILQLWEKEHKVITLMLPEGCDDLEAIRSYLQDWIDNHFIDAQVEILQEGY